MNTYLTLPLIVFVLALALIIPVLRKDYKSTAHRTFSLFLFAMGLWGLFTFGMRSSPTLERALVWDKLVMPAVLLSSLFYYHFTVAYTNVKLPRWFLPAVYVFVLVLVACTPTDLWIAGMQVKPYGYAPIPGTGFMILILIAYLFAGLGVVNLLRGYRASRVYEARNRYVYLVIGASLLLFGRAFDILEVLGLLLYPGAMISNVLFCLITATAIGRYRLFDIRVVIRKSLPYILLSAGVAAVYVGFIATFSQLFGLEELPLWLRFVLLMAFALVLQPIWLRLQHLVDRWFYRKRYDFLRELEDFSQQSHDVTKLDDITFPLVTLLYRALQASSVHLLLATSSGSFNVTSSIGIKTAQFILERHSPLLGLMQTRSDIVYYRDRDVIPQLQALTEREMVPLGIVRAALLVPLKNREGGLVGLLIIGEKLSGETYYSIEDERLVLTLASRMALEIENALRYASESSARRELQLQNEQKTEFLHAVAHELKTPLTAIISSSELLGSELSVPADSPLHRLVSNINRSAWSMEKRTSELLDFAKIQIGGLSVECHPMEIGPALEEIASLLSVLFKNRSQPLELDIPDSLPKVLADKDRLEQIITNLLSNANKYSPLGSKIILRVHEKDSRVRVEVQDMAQPIRKEERTKIFEPYYRSSSAEKRQRMPGLGLGLSISKRLVELQGGEMWVESEPDKGNTFIFWLPATDQTTE